MMVVLAFQLDLASALDADATVVLDLPWARADSSEDVPGREITDLDPGEVQVPTAQFNVPDSRLSSDGSLLDQVFVDPSGLRVRLRFAASVCSTLVLRPPRENDQQIYLDVVTTTPTTACTEQFHADDLLVTLAAPLGGRQVIISEESRTGPAAGDEQ